MNRILRSAIVLACLAATTAAVEGRGILICVAATAPPAIRSAVDGLAADADRVPLFAALRRTQGAGAPTVIDSASLLDERKAWDRAAYNHLIVVGLPGQDPVLDKVWGYDVAVDATAHTLYREGYGHFAGDMGVVESDRNPYLHSPRIDSSAFDTCLVKLSGSSEAGVLAAVAAFHDGLLNGLVPVGKPARSETSILDLDPASEPPPMHDALPGGGLCAGWTQCAANEYRACIDAGGAEPQRLWRVKWLLPSGWDCIGAKAWLAGVHRMAFGNAANIARFADAATAVRVADAIVKDAHGRPADAIAGGPAWRLDAPSDEAIDPGDVLPTLVFSRGSYVVMATLTPAQAAAIAGALPR